MKKILCYLLAGLLMAFYFAVLGASLDTSGVTEDYRRIYLEKSDLTVVQRIEEIVAEKGEVTWYKP